MEFKSSLRGRYLLSYIRIPVTVYNVNTKNQQIPFQEGGVGKFAELTPAATRATEIGENIKSVGVLFVERIDKLKTTTF